MKRVFVLMIMGLMLLTLVACGNDSSSQIPLRDNVPTDILGQIADEGKLNVGKDAGTYVTPDESDFEWEAVDGGVCITDYDGEATAVRIPAELGGQPVVAIDRGISMEAQFTGLIFPDSVVTIGEEAFSFCSSLVEVQFGSGLKTIEYNAFIGCSALTELTFNEGLETIGYNAFAMCSSLKRINFSSTIHTIVSGAFCMSGLETVTVPGTVKSLGRQTFADCQELKEVTVEEGVETFDKEIFSLCANLKTVTLPASLTEIGMDIVRDCENVTLRVVKNSFAESYAIDNELSYEVI